RGGGAGGGGGGSRGPAAAPPRAQAPARQTRLTTRPGRTTAIVPRSKISTSPVRCPVVTACATASRPATVAAAAAAAVVTPRPPPGHLVPADQASRAPGVRATRPSPTRCAARAAAP